MSSPRNRRLPLRAVLLFVGLILYGLSLAMMVEAGLGLSPWNVLDQGLSRTFGIDIGLVVTVVGGLVLLLWIPLRQRPGFGTVANVVVVGLVLDAGLVVLPDASWLPYRIGYLVAGVLLNGLATGMYIGARMGPGPRDGLMTGLHARFPRFSLRVTRTAIELTVLAAGFLLGGTAGVGTVVYALAIGPLAQLFLPLLTINDRPIDTGRNVPCQDTGR